MTYTHLLFDLDHTLFDFDKSAEVSLEKLIRSFGIAYHSDLQNTYAKVNRGVWQEFAAGTLPQANIKTERFRRFATAANLDIDPVVAGDRFLTYLAEGTHLLDGAEELIAQLRGRVVLAAVTNGLKEVQRSRLDQSTLAGVFDVIVVSDEVGVAKPDPAIFDIALEALGNPPKANILYIGDSLKSDVQGGNNAGIDTCWFNPKDLDIPDAPRPTHTVSTLADILRLLD